MFNSQFEFKNVRVCASRISLLTFPLAIPENRITAQTPTMKYKRMTENNDE